MGGGRSFVGLQGDHAAMAQVLAGQRASTATDSTEVASGGNPEAPSERRARRHASGSLGDSSGLHRSFSRNTLKWEANLVATRKQREA